MATDTIATDASSAQSPAAGQHGKSADSLEKLIAEQLEHQKALDASMAQLRTQYSVPASTSVPTAPTSSTTAGTMAFWGLTLLLIVFAGWYAFSRFKGHKYLAMVKVSPDASQDFLYPASNVRATKQDATMAVPSAIAPLDSVSPSAISPKPVMVAQQNLEHEESSAESLQAALEAESSWMGELQQTPSVHVDIDMDSNTSWDASLLMAKEYEKLGQWEEAASIYEQAMHRGDQDTRDKARRALSTLLPGT